MTRTEVSQSIGFNLDAPYFVVTFHPVTLENNSAGGQFNSLLDALEEFPEYKVVFTKTNADTDGRVINRMIDRFVEKHPERCMAAVSLGMIRYLSAVKYAAAVIGNSSSGIVEVPSLKVPTINIGDRQKGRVRPSSVIDCESEQTAIGTAIRRAIDHNFRLSLENMVNPYDRANTARAIMDAISKISLDGILKKQKGVCHVNQQRPPL